MILAVHAAAHALAPWTDRRRSSVARCSLKRWPGGTDTRRVSFDKGFRRKRGRHRASDFEHLPEVPGTPQCRTTLNPSGPDAKWSQAELCKYMYMYMYMCSGVSAEQGCLRKVVCRGLFAPTIYRQTEAYVVCWVYCVRCRVITMKGRRFIQEDRTPFRRLVVWPERPRRPPRRSHAREA